GRFILHLASPAQGGGQAAAGAQGGGKGRGVICWLSSLQCCPVVYLTLGDLCFGVYQGGDGRVAAQLVQAAGAAGADAAGRDAQRGADLGIGQRRVFQEQDQ